MHTGAVEPQTELATHVHIADPAPPVHACSVSGHDSGVPYAQQPLLPRVHVARLPATQVVSPWLQLLVQAREHEASGAEPEQDCGSGHGDVDAT